MTTELIAQLKKLTRRQKLSLADRLLADAGAHQKPSGIRGSKDPDFEDELRSRHSDRDAGAWLSINEFKARTRRR